MKDDMSNEIPADDLLYVLELVKGYCDDLMSGSYAPAPSENPLLKISDMINIGMCGSIHRPAAEGELPKESDNEGGSSYKVDECARGR